MNKTNIKAFLNDENGQGMVEYVLIACVLVLASYGMINLFISAWNAKFNKIANARTGIAGMAP